MSWRRCPEAEAIQVKEQEQEQRFRDQLYYKDISHVWKK